MPSDHSPHALTHLYRFLIDHVPVGIVQTRPDGQILYHNPRAREILGYEREDWPYLNAQELSLSPRSIRTYRIRILEKIGLNTDAELIFYALRQGLIENL